MKKRSLLHFLFFSLLLAIGLLIVFGLPATGEEQRRIVINDGDIAQLRASWYRQWQREPTLQELRGLMENHVRNEVLYREALARRLDEDDQVVKMTMVRKMEFLGETQTEAADPTEEEIEAYYALAKERYRRPGAASFAQVFINRDDRGEQAEAIAREVLSRLQGSHPDSLDLSAVGDPIMLETYYRDLSEQQIANAFGADFAEQVLQLEAGTWQGPVPSGYGLHLVYLLDKEASVIPDWRSVRAEVEEDLRREAVEASKELFYTEILRNYQVLYRGEVIDLLGEEGEK